MKQTLARGFTLIELLVVIAIIGILAAVVLTSLTGAQEGAQNSNIQQALGSAVAGAQLHYNDNGFTYATVCDAGSAVRATLDQLSTAIPSLGDVVVGTTGTLTDADIYCNGTATEYVISAPLVGSDDFYCVDSDGARIQISTRTAGDTTCS